MTLLEWAFREGLTHTTATGYRSIAEVVHSGGDDPKRALWYVYRLARNGRILRLTRPGNPSTVTRTEPHELHLLTRSDFSPTT